MSEETIGVDYCFIKLAISRLLDRLIAREVRVALFAGEANWRSLQQVCFLVLGNRYSAYVRVLSSCLATNNAPQFKHSSSQTNLYLHMTLQLCLRVLRHAHARIFAWLLGTCISETTADIAGNQTPLSRKTMRQAVKNYTSKHSTRKKLSVTVFALSSYVYIQKLNFCNRSMREFY